MNISDLQLSQTNKPKFSHYHGRMFWKIPHQFIRDELFMPISWGKLSLAGKGILPVLQIFSDQGMCDASTNAISHFSGYSYSQTCKGLKDLCDNKLISQKLLCYTQSFKFPHSKKFLDQLGNPKRNYVMFSGSLVKELVWADLSPCAKAVFIVLLTGIVGKDMETHAEMFEAKANPLNGQQFDTPSEWIDGKGKISWPGIMNHLAENEELKRKYVDLLPCISLKSGDRNYVGIPTISRLAGIDLKSARKAIIELEQKRLILVFPPDSGKYNSRRFFLPKPQALLDLENQRHSS
ncbi:MAG: hypothetical protein PHR77_18195 [Kiritimatiellae bacterium]|nr:hypothetical protein [Kiritimatiellia bacterium]MDD5523401.1 hypothetical protein [Kiritimatiellia bacterium]